MKKIIVVFLILAFAMPVLTAPAFAAPAKEMKMGMHKGVVDVGNKLCPVSGDPVSGKNFVTYKGKRYGLCCPQCKKPFLKEPDKYIAKMNAQEAKVVVPPASVEPIVEKPMKDMKSEEKKMM
jgi:YHS domain-containing protein